MKTLILLFALAIGLSASLVVLSQETSSNAPDTPSVNCDAAPYGASDAEYDAYIKNLDSLVPASHIFPPICRAKFLGGDRTVLNHLGISDEQIDTESVGALVLEELRLLKDLVGTDPTGNIDENSYVPRKTIYGLFLCYGDGECRLYSTPHSLSPDTYEEDPAVFSSLQACLQQASLNSGGLHPRQDGRTMIGEGSWWECRSKQIDTWNASE